MQFTPTQKSVASWLLIALLTSLALWLLGRVLTPFIVAAVLAYALTPLVDRLDELGRGRMPRVVAVVIVELLLILVLIGLVLMVVADPGEGGAPDPRATALSVRQAQRRAGALARAVRASAFRWTWPA